jgi:gliding motility-associated-like protein
MKTLLYFLCCVLLVFPLLAVGQHGDFAVQNGMNARPKNYSSFTTQYQNLSEEAKLANKEYANHPELGMLFPEAPCADCYELIAERTESSKRFVIAGTNGRDVALQTFTDAIHYRDEQGQWRTIKTKLEARGHDRYGALEQPVPVSINPNWEGYTELGGEGFFRFNHGLELVYRRPDGREKSLGQANWKERTLGDDGCYITNAWPGIDLEMTVSRGALKTNFYIKHAFHKYADGQLLLRDHLEMGNGLQLYAAGSKDFKGNLEVRDTKGVSVYLVSAATAYAKADVEHTLQMIGYDIKGDTLDIVVPGGLLDQPSSAYPLVIDPLVSTATSSTVGGSSYSPTKTVGCTYVNAATVPPNVTVTDVRWSFNYVASGGAQLLHGAVDFTLGGCRSPGVAGFFWYCNLASAGTCTGTNISIMPDISSCIAPPQCPSYPMNLNMRFYQNYATTTPCATTYVTSGTPLSVTVFGRTVETSPISSAGGLLAICLGQSVTLSTTASFGVPPYDYLWTPPILHGNPMTFTPVATTSYSVTVTDACGMIATAAQTIVVTPIAPNAGTHLVCVGSTTIISNPTVGGTWSSANGAIAVIGPSSGVVTGVSPGTTTISYTTAAGCYATSVVTVIPVPSAISGTPTLCQGATTSLTDPTPAGTWSSSAVGVAAVGAGTGLVTGASPGTATITYSTSPGCDATMEVTVYANPVISSTATSNPTTCGASDGSITLFGLVPGVVYNVDWVLGGSPVSAVLTADVSGSIVITGLTAGVYTGIMVKSPEGCTGSWATPITLVDTGTPTIPVAGSNSPLCDGWLLKLTAMSDPGVSYSWSGPGGFSSTLQNPEIDPVTPVNAGVYTVIATLGGCVSAPGTTTVVVNLPPQITALETTNPTTCSGSEGRLILKGLTPGIAYTVGYTQDGIPTTTTVTADAAGNVTISGRPAGTYTGIFVVSLSCISNLVGPVTLVDPLLPPAPSITSNAPICVGLTLLLYGNDDKDGGTYSWVGPNGFTSNLRNPKIPNVPATAQGVYTLTYTLFNCTNTTSTDIQLQPVIELKDVYATKYLLPYGDSVQLHASGAAYYNWTPHNGTIRNPYIANSFVRPQDSIAVYTIHGANEWGCQDSVDVTLRVIFDEIEYIPNAFTPNGDGKNDVFRIGKMQYKKLIDFTIYDRWGQEVYHNPWDPNNGWDGTSRGIKQDMGTYYYSIIIESPSGKLRYYKGDVTLIR